MVTGRVVVAPWLRWPRVGSLGLVLGEGEVILFFLQEVKPQQRVEPIQTCEQVVDLVGLYSVAGLSERQMCADPIGQSLDLGVGSAHGGRGFAATERAGQCRVELCLLGTFVGQDPLNQKGVRTRQ